VIGFEEPFDFSPELRIASASTGEEGVALVGRKRARGVKDLLECLQRRRVHRMGLTEDNEGNEWVQIEEPNESLPPCSASRSECEVSV
jgi:hypothetical protein